MVIGLADGHASVGEIEAVFKFKFGGQHGEIVVEPVGKPKLTRYCAMSYCLVLQMDGDTVIMGDVVADIGKAAVGETIEPLTPAVALGIGDAGQGYTTVIDTELVAGDQIIPSVAVVLVEFHTQTAIHQRRLKIV